MFIYKKNRLKMTTVQVVFDQGSLMEPDGQKGTRHLMEHIICKSFKDMIPELTRKGISWNASTSDEFVVFYFSGLNSKLTSDLKIKLVERILGNLTLHHDEFLMERKVVLQEYMDVFEDPVSCKGSNIIRKHFGEYGAIGLYHDIENFTYQDAKELKRSAFSVPARIIEVGPTKTEYFETLSYDNETKCSAVKYKNSYKLPMESIKNDDRKTSVFALSKKKISKGDFTYIVAIIGIMNGSLDSPLYDEIRVKRGLSYYSKMFTYKFYDRAYLMFAANTDNERSDELVNVYRDVLFNVEKYITKERFENMMSEVEIMYETQDILRYSNVGDYVRKGYIKAKKSAYVKLSYDKLVEVAKKYINEKNIVIEKW